MLKAFPLPVAEVLTTVATASAFKVSVSWPCPNSKTVPATKVAPSKSSLSLVLDPLYVKADENTSTPVVMVTILLLEDASKAVILVAVKSFIIKFEPVAVIVTFVASAKVAPLIVLAPEALVLSVTVSILGAIIEPPVVKLLPLKSKVRVSAPPAELIWLIVRSLPSAALISTSAASARSVITTAPVRAPLALRLVSPVRPVMS